MRSVPLSTFVPAQSTLALSETRDAGSSLGKPHSATIWRRFAPVNGVTARALVQTIDSEARRAGRRIGVSGSGLDETRCMSVPVDGGAVIFTWYELPEFASLRIGYQPVMIDPYAVGEFAGLEHCAITADRVIEPE